MVIWTKQKNAILSMSKFHREAVVWMCSVKKVLLEISQNSQENTCVKVSFSIKSDCEFCKISKNTCSYRTPLVAASVHQYSPEHSTYTDCVGCLSSKFHTPWTQGVKWTYIRLMCVCLKSRSSHPEVFSGKGFLKIYSKFTGELACRSVISIKLLWNF